MRSLRDELQSIYDKHGHLSPSMVVDEWRDPDHPFHDRLTWDDSVAAELRRRDEARLLIRKVRVTYAPATARKPERTVRAFHPIPTGTRGEQDFYSAEDIARDPVMTSVLLAEMEREWRAFKARWARFAEFAAMIEGDDLAA